MSDYDKPVTPATKLHMQKLEKMQQVEQMPIAKKYDDGKPRTDLLPFDALLGTAEVLKFGAAKYGDRNWEKGGLSFGRLAGACLRHLFAFMSGEEKDPESGLPHIDHFVCCALMLSATIKRKIGKDDRK